MSILIAYLTFSASGGTVSSASVITQYGAITIGNSNPLITNTPNGDTCFSAIILPHTATSTLTVSQNKLQKWFTFTPTTPEIKITLTNTSMSSSRIEDLILMEGICNLHRIIAIDSSYRDTTLTIVLHEAVVGIPYFISTVRCPTCSSTANFDLKVESLTPPTQTFANGVVYMNGVASHMQQQIVVRINKSHLNLSNINDTTIVSGTASQFLDTTTISNIANIMYNGNVGLVNGLNMTKVFPNMTSSDTLSLSRDSSLIRVPDFFEIFVLTVTEKDKIFYSSRLLSTIIGYGEPNFVGKFTGVPNDMFYNNSPFQASLHPTTAYPNANINVQGAWDIETGQSFIKVGIYDSGIDGTHNELNSSKVLGGYDFHANTAITSGTNNDDVSHGTACAGIIGAYRNNFTGIAGIAGGDHSLGNSGCSLYDMKMGWFQSTSTNSNGTGIGVQFVPTSTIAQAITKGATSTGAGGFGLHIMNNSYSLGNHYTTALHDAVQNAAKNGVVFVASRGNYPDDSPLGSAIYPACLQDEMVISVGACGTNGKWKTTSNGDPSAMPVEDYQSMTGQSVDVIAPGSTALVYTTENPGSTTQYRTFNGTSAASPHVAGVAALMLSHVDQSTPATNNLVIEDVEQILQMSANNIQSGAGNYDDNNGWGLIDATAAMNSIKAPEFKIQHFGVGQNLTSPASISKTLALSNIELILPVNFQGLAAGTYFGDQYRVDITLNYNLSSTNDLRLNAWPRFSSTLGWSGATPVLHLENWCQIISVTNYQAVLRTFIYDFKYDEYGNAIDPMLPTANPRAALSIYTKDPTVGIAKISDNNNSLMAVYPNPANNNSIIDISLTRSQQVSLELYDTKGSLIKTIIKGKVTEGLTKYQVSLSDISQGAYFYRLVTEDGICEKKLIVIK